MTQIRKFETGATRNIDVDKYDYEAFLSPLVLERFAEYMHKNRRQADGSLRDGDNWQKGIPKDAYMKSMFRHFFDVWKEHRGHQTPAGIEEDLCALMFNAMGMLHEIRKENSVAKQEVYGAGEVEEQGTVSAVPPWKRDVPFVAPVHYANLISP